MDMLYGWTFKEWAIAIRWAKHTGHLKGPVTLESALNLKCEYECGYATAPGGSNLVNVPERETDYPAAHDLFIAALDHMSSDIYPPNQLAKLLYASKHA